MTSAEVLVNHVCQKLPAVHTRQGIALFSMLKTSYLSLPVAFSKVSANVKPFTISYMLRIIQRGIGC